MKLLCLDVGNKRIGVAFGETDLRIATPLDVIERTTIEADATIIGALIRDYAAERIVVGLPRNTDGTLGDQGEATQEYVHVIGPHLQVPLVLWDEHLTTVEATRRGQDAGGHGKKARKKLDAIAAAVILQDYINSQAGQYAG